MIQCSICGNSEKNRIYAVREMMFGFRDEFAYFECSNCHCLQIAEIPKDLSKYYPRNYYSFSSFQLPKPGRIRRFLRQKRVETGLFGKGGLIGKLVYAAAPWEYLQAQSLAQVSLNRKSHILDVGCGNGDLLYILREIGFENLQGIDAYIDADIERDNGTKIRKATIQKVSGKWDLVMFHHSFEHMPDQLAILKRVAELLAENGVCLINMPTVSSYAWKHYRENWVAIDAPRHLCIHSIESMTLLAEKAHLILQTILYNSIELQFWGSEQYLKGIPLCSERSYGEKPANSIFSENQIKMFKRKAKELNRIKQGDAAAFYLRKQLN